MHPLTDICQLVSFIADVVLGVFKTKKGFHPSLGFSLKIFNFFLVRLQISFIFAPANRNGKSVHRDFGKEVLKTLTSSILVFLQNSLETLFFSSVLAD